MDGTWFQRLEAERRAGNLTRAERDALHALGRMLAMGDGMPSEARIASESGVSKRTVCRAKVRARELGLLQWERRFTGQALRCELPCAYRAETPTRAVVKRERQRGARVQEGRMLRSVQQQLAALGPITPAHLALWAARDAVKVQGGRLGLAGLGGAHRRSSGLGA